MEKLNQGTTDNKEEFIRIRYAYTYNVATADALFFRKNNYNIRG